MAVAVLIALWLVWILALRWFGESKRRDTVVGMPWFAVAALWLLLIAACGMSEHSLSGNLFGWCVQVLVVFAAAVTWIWTKHRVYR